MIVSGVAMTGKVTSMSTSVLFCVVQMVSRSNSERRRRRPVGAATAVVLLALVSFVALTVAFTVMLIAEWVTSSPSTLTCTCTSPLVLLMLRVCRNVVTVVSMISATCSDVPVVTIVCDEWIELIASVGGVQWQV